MVVRERVNKEKGAQIRPTNVVLADNSCAVYDVAMLTAEPFYGFEGKVFAGSVGELGEAVYRDRLGLNWGVSSWFTDR